MTDITQSEGMTPPQESSEKEIELLGKSLNIKLTNISRLARRIPNQITPFAIQAKPLTENEAIVRTQVSMDKPSPTFDRVSFQSYTGTIDELTREQMDRMRLGPSTIKTLEEILGFRPNRYIATSTLDSSTGNLLWRYYYINTEGKGMYVIANPADFEPKHPTVAIGINKMIEDDYKALHPIADSIIGKLETVEK